MNPSFGSQLDIGGLTGVRANAGGLQMGIPRGIPGLPGMGEINRSNPEGDLGQKSEPIKPAY